MRLISFALTQDQILAKTKTQTRRLGWRHAKVGDRLRGVRKVQGRRKGEPLVDLAIVEITAVRRERLCDITAEDLAREGFPGMPPADFVALFPCEPETEVTVIDFKYLDRFVLEFMGRQTFGSWPDRIANAARLLDNQPNGARPKAGTAEAVLHMLVRHV